jgi:hypothetical protein
MKSPLAQEFSKARLLPILIQVFRRELYQSNKNIKIACFICIRKFEDLLHSLGISVHFVQHLCKNTENESISYLCKFTS